MKKVSVAGTETAKAKVLRKCPRAYCSRKGSGGLWAVYMGTAARYNDWLATADSPVQAWAAALKRVDGSKQ